MNQNQNINNLNVSIIDDLQKEVKCITSLSLFGLFDAIKLVCEHSWINTGMTSQGVALKRCMKCGKIEQTVS